MITTKKIALLVDVDNVKIGGEAFNELYGKLNEIGDVVYCKFYGYNDRKHIYLSDAIAKFGYETAPFMRYKKRFSQLDSRMIVDALKLNYTKTEIDTYCIVAGDGDLIPLLVELKTSGRTLIDINTPYQEQNYHLFDAHLNLDTLLLEAETYKPKIRKSTAKPKVEKPKPTITVQREAAVQKEIFTAPRQVEKPKEIIVKSKMVDKKEDSFNLEDMIQKPTKTDSVVEEKSTQSVDDQLGEVLRNITNRYAELDFETNDDMDKKLQLIKDIESFIKTETSKGEGLNSSNEEVRQIFAELSGIVDDMKNAI